MAGLLKEITPAIQLIGSGLSGAMTGTAGAAEQMKRGFAGLWDTLMTGAGEAIKGIAAALGKGITEGVPKLIAAASEMINTIGQGLVTGIPNFANKALDLINGFADMLTANLPTLIQAGISFVTNLAQGLVNALPDFIAKAPEIISKFANLINDNMPKILAVAVNIIVTLVKGLISAIPTLVANIPKIITAIVDVWSAFNWAQLGKNAIGFLRDGITSMIGADKNGGNQHSEHGKRRNPGFAGEP